MKKIGFLLILCSIVSGCAGNKIFNIEPDHTLTAPRNSIVVGKLSLENIPGTFSNCVITLATKDWAQEFPIHIPEAVSKDLGGGQSRNDFYFFVEMPPGEYDFRQALVEHDRFHDLKFYMLSANLMVPEESIVYVGNITVQPIGRALNMLGPTTEVSIRNEPNDVLREFVRRYPEYKRRKVTIKPMNRYELFRDGGLGGNF